jgi:hypothetical protein
MPFNSESIKKYLIDCNISIKGVLHVGSKSDNIQAIYNSVNVHNNNIIWVESDKLKAAKNIELGLPNCFTTIIDNPDNVKKHNSNQAPLNCQLECCIDLPKLIITELDNSETQTLEEFMAKNNFDPAEFNVWNFDCMGAEFRIFKGSQNLLKFVDIIYTGVNSTVITKKSDIKSDFDVLLKSYGLTRIETIKNDDNWCMALYIRI